MITELENKTACELVEIVIQKGLLNALCDEECRYWFANSELNKEGFWVKNGATKICIGHCDLPNWVIKVGFNDLKFDYATIEYENYLKAVKENLSYYFPEIFFLGDFEGYSFYLQRRVECGESQFYTDCFTSLRDQHNENGDEYSEDDLWDEFENLDDEERIYLIFQDRKLCDFLRKNDIGDLHSGNFGYTEGHLVIIDFSGYMD